MSALGATLATSLDAAIASSAPPAYLLHSPTPPSGGGGGTGGEARVSELLAAVGAHDLLRAMQAGMPYRHAPSWWFATFGHVMRDGSTYAHDVREAEALRHLPRLLTALGLPPGFWASHMPTRRSHVSG